jgi:cytochrome c553
VTVPSSQAQTKDEKQFMKQHEKEMTTFMEKCSGCHSLQRIFAKKRSKEDWDKLVKMMAGKPHANISDQDMKNIEKWIGFMQSAFTP